MTRRLWRPVAAVAGVTLVTLLVLEATVRLSGYAERHLYDPIYTRPEGVAEIPYVHRPNLAQARARGLAIIDTDGLGLRALSSGGTPGSKREREFRIAVIGDSVTFGEGVARTADTYAQVLAAELNRRQRNADVTVFNFGVSAYSVREMAATLEHRVAAVDPDLVLMAIIAADFNLGRTPVVDASGYLIDQTLEELSPASATLRRFVRSLHLSYVVRDIALRWFASGTPVLDALARGGIPESYRHVEQFARTAQLRGLAYRIVLLPRLEGRSWAPLPGRLAGDRIAYVDLGPVGSEFSVAAFMASRYDVHPSPAVHRRIGEVLAEHVEREILPGATRRPALR